MGRFWDAKKATLWLKKRFPVLLVARRINCQKQSVEKCVVQVDGSHWDSKGDFTYIKYNRTPIHSSDTLCARISVHRRCVVDRDSKASTDERCLSTVLHGHRVLQVGTVHRGGWVLNRRLIVSSGATGPSLLLQHSFDSLVDTAA